ncbi:hypothetical protein TWF281_002884 [Arthrobotrys megalospora]
MLWVLAGGSLALSEAGSHGGLTHDALAARRASPEVDYDPEYDPNLDPNLDPDSDTDWDEDLAVRDIIPELFDSQHLRRRGLLDSMNVKSYNIHPDVVNDDPVIVRMNPSREHMEYFCNWRSPRDGFDVRYAYQLFSKMLLDFSRKSSKCSGPANFCTKAVCREGYIVEVCQYGDKPWELPCDDVLDMARDSMMAVGNRDMGIWENGFVDVPRSKQQETNDRKKMCVEHSSVYQPEALVIAFWNANPRFHVRTSYGYPPERISCEQPGVQYSVMRQAASQEQYLKNWYDRITLAEIEGEEGGGKKNPKPAAKAPNSGNVTTENGDETHKGRVFPPKGSPNDTDAEGLPYYEDPHGTYPTVVEVVDKSGYRGPAFEDYNPEDMKFSIFADHKWGNLTTEDTVAKAGSKSNKTIEGLKVPEGLTSSNSKAPKQKDGGKDDDPVAPVPKEVPFQPMWAPPERSSTTSHTPIAIEDAYDWKTWTIDTTRKPFSLDDSDGGRPKATAAPVEAASTTPAQPNTSVETGGVKADNVENTAASTAAAAQTSAAPTRENTATPTAASVTTAPPTAEGTTSAVKADAPGATPTVPPTPSGEAKTDKKDAPPSAKDEPTAAKVEPTATAKDEPAKASATAAKEEPAPPKPETPPAKAEPTPTAKDEPKPTTAPSETPKP